MAGQGLELRVCVLGTGLSMHLTAESREHCSLALDIARRVAGRGKNGPAPGEQPASGSEPQAEAHPLPTQVRVKGVQRVQEAQRILHVTGKRMGRILIQQRTLKGEEQQVEHEHDWVGILDLHRSFTKDDLTKKWKKYALLFHPDKWSDEDKEQMGGDGTCRRVWDALDEAYNLAMQYIEKPCLNQVGYRWRRHPDLRRPKPEPPQKPWPGPDPAMPQRLDPGAVTIIETDISQYLLSRTPAPGTPVTMDNNWRGRGGHAASRFEEVFKMTGGYGGISLPAIFH